MDLQKQTNCPNCNYPDESSGYHYRGRYLRGKRCAGCNYTENYSVTVNDLQFTQRCTVKLSEDQEFLVIVDRSKPENPVFKFFIKSSIGSLIPHEPEKVQKKILAHYADEEWRRWLKFT